jgi:hypothetical protein
MNAEDLITMISFMTDSQLARLRLAINATKDVSRNPIIVNPIISGTIGSMIGNVADMQPTPIYSISIGNIEVLSDNETELPWQFWETLKVVSKTIALRYPDRKALKMEILRGSGVGENGAHSEGKDAVDIHYYTWSDSNHTQVSHPGSPRIEIFDKNGNLLLSQFDAVRVRETLSILKRVFPKLTAWVDDRMSASLKLSWLRYDNKSSGYNHWGHMHIVCGNEYNPEAVI